MSDKIKDRTTQHPGIIPVDMNGDEQASRRTEKYTFDDEDEDRDHREHAIDKGFNKGRNDVSNLVVPVGDIKIVMPYINVHQNQK